MVLETGNESCSNRDICPRNNIEKEFTHKNSKKDFFDEDIDNDTNDRSLNSTISKKKYQEHDIADSNSDDDDDNDNDDDDDDDNNHNDDNNN